MGRDLDRFFGQSPFRGPARVRRQPVGPGLVPRAAAPVRISPPIQRAQRTETPIFDDTAGMDSTADKPDDAIAAAETRIRRASEKKLQHDKRAFLIDFLGVLDNLDRAVNAASTAMDTTPTATPSATPSATPISEGVQLVRRSFLRTLAKHDVYHVPALGQTFNPDQHEAVSTLDVNDAIDERRVVAVVREGYRIGNATLRPAQVVVGRYVEGS